MNILLTNDDGILSPGFIAACEAAGKFGNLFIAAPSTQKTASGRSLIGNKDEKFVKSVIPVGKKEFEAYHMDCTPALVIKMAVNTIFRDVKFDLAVSGINYGENLGPDIIISGTLGAAFETASTGIPSIAISRQTSIDNHFNYAETDWNAAKHFLSIFIERFVRNKKFTGFDILKIDVPEHADTDTGWVLTRLSKKPYFKSYVENGSIDSKVSDLKLKLNNTKHYKGSDSYTILKEKKVSVTPITFDFSARPCDCGNFFK